MAWRVHTDNMARDLDIKAHKGDNRRREGENMDVQEVAKLQVEKTRSQLSTKKQKIPPTCAS